MITVEEFLSQRTSYCERLRMRLTPEGCAAIRNRAPISWAFDDICSAPKQCADCPGLNAPAIVPKSPVDDAGSIMALPLVEDALSAFQVETDQESNKADSLSEEVIMAEEQVRTMTTEELAALAGVTAKSVCDARKLARMGTQSVKGKCGKVIATMREHNITWEQVIGRRPGKPKVSPFISNVAKPEKTPSLEEFATDVCLPDDEDYEENNVPSTLKAYTLDRPEYVRDFPLSHIPLEALVGEITRRMPRAEVMLR